MADTDRGEDLDDAVAAHDHGDDAPVEIHGPASEAARIVRRASPLRLALRLALVAALAGVAAAAGWRGHAWWVGHAREARDGAVGP